MVDKFWTDIILVISSRRGIISVAIGGKGNRGTNEVIIRIVIIVVFRISIRVVVVVAIGIIIDIIFTIVIIVDGNIVAETEAPLAIVIFGVAFGCGIKLAFGRGEGTFIIRLKRIMIVVFEIIINVVFGIVIAVLVVIIVYREDSTLSGRTPAIGIIIVRDKTKSPIIIGIRVLDTAVINHCHLTTIFSFYYFHFQKHKKRPARDSLFSEIILGEA